MKLSPQSLNKTDRQLLLFWFMKCNETRNTKQNNKTAILDKLKESIMKKEVDSNGVEDLSKKDDNPDDAAELIKKIECIMKSKKNNILMLAHHQGIIFIIQKYRYI